MVKSTFFLVLSGGVPIGTQKLKTTYMRKLTIAFITSTLTEKFEFANFDPNDGHVANSESPKMIM